MFVTMVFPVFLGIVVTLFFLLPVKRRPVLLLLSSYVFCGWIDLRGLAVLLFISLVTWRAGIRIESLRGKTRGRGAKKDRGFTVFMVCFLAAVLCVYKFGNYCLSHVNWQAPQAVTAGLAMPVGMSFYMFQAIGYLTDIYKEKSGAEKNFIFLGCYLAFFPKLVSGPIEREQDFIPQLKGLYRVKFGDRGRLSTAFTYMLWGYFMKMVVADRLAVTVNRIFAAPESFDSVWLLVGAFFYTMQIYCDFAGYSYIAIGCAKIFGIDLAQNFKGPYCAESITDFWRRWHISLSTWFRDYVYIPLGGNRAGTVRHLRNMFVVWFLTGLWHGAAWNFVLWGLYYGVLLTLEKYVWGEKLAKLPGWICHLYAVVIVVFGFVIFVFDDMGQLGAYLALMFGVSGNGLLGSELFWYIKNYAPLLIAAVLLSFPLYPFLKRKAESLPRWGKTALSLIGAAGYAALFVLTTAYLVNDTYNPFLYFRF